jgi:hypothetical protein
MRLLFAIVLSLGILVFPTSLYAKLDFYCLKFKAKEKLNRLLKHKDDQLLSFIPTKLAKETKDSRKLKIIDDIETVLVKSDKAKAQKISKAIKRSNLTEDELKLLKESLSKNNKIGENNIELVEAYFDFLRSLTIVERKEALRAFPNVLTKDLPLNLSVTNRIKTVQDELKVALNLKKADDIYLLNKFLKRYDQLERFETRRINQLTNSMKRKKKVLTKNDVEEIKSRAKFERSRLQQWKNICLKEVRGEQKIKPPTAENLSKKQKLLKALKFRRTAKLPVSQAAAQKKKASIMKKILTIMGVADPEIAIYTAATVGVTTGMYLQNTYTEQKSKDPRYWYSLGYEVFNAYLYGVLSGKILNMNGAGFFKRYIGLQLFKGAYDVPSSIVNAYAFADFYEDYAEDNKEIEKFIDDPRMAEVEKEMQEYVEMIQVQQNMEADMQDIFGDEHFDEDFFDDPELTSALGEVMVVNVADQMQAQSNEDDFWQKTMDVFQEKYLFNRKFSSYMGFADVGVILGNLYTKCIGAGRFKLVNRALIATIFMYKYMYNSYYYAQRNEDLGY